MDFYLRIATELPLKRLIVGGMEAVRNRTAFQKQGMDSNHNPEFTTVEAYLAYGDIEDMMELAESLFEHLALKIHGTTEIEYQEHTISLKAPFARLHMVDGIKQATGIDFFKVTDLDEALELAKSMKYTFRFIKSDRSHYQFIFRKYVEGTIINRPLFMDIR